MNIECLFVQRKERYEGQYSPELIAAIDEYGNDDNPDYLNDKEEKVRKDMDISFYKRITISVPIKYLMKYFMDKKL